MSADACQGLEADVVVISTVRSTDVGIFVEDPQRLCVTLSRARHACVIIGDRDNFRKRGNAQWRAIETHFDVAT